MDDSDIGRDQAHLVLRAMMRSGLRLGQVWMHYFSIGGDVGQFEVEAFLENLTELPALERDMLAHAVNELLPEARVEPVPYTSDLLQTRSREDVADFEGRQDSDDRREDSDNRRENS